MNLGSTIAIMQDGKILLTKREDFEVWCLPGGSIDPGESLPQTAVREAREETGLEVELVKLVGVYSRLGGGSDSHVVLFAAKPVGGQLKPQVNEVLDLGYFDPEALPEDMFRWHRPQIADAFSQVEGGLARTFTVNTAQQFTTRQELYDLRDQSGVSRAAFFKQFFDRPGTYAEILEVDRKQP